MSTWFQSKVKFLRQMDNGLVKQITEQYLVDAMSFTEAEARVISEIGEGMREVEMMAISKSNIKEVVFYGDTDLWFKTKVTYNMMDEDTEKEKEKKITTYMLVNANDLKEAYERTEEHLKEMLVPFQIPKIEESPIIEVYQYQKPAPAGHKKVEKPFDPELWWADRHRDHIEQIRGEISREKELWLRYCSIWPISLEDADTFYDWAQDNIRVTKHHDPTGGQAHHFKIEEEYGIADLFKRYGVEGLAVDELKDIKAHARRMDVTGFVKWITGKYPKLEDYHYMTIYDSIHYSINEDPANQSSAAGE